MQYFSEICINCSQNYQEMHAFQPDFAYFQPNRLKYAIFEGNL